MSRPAALRDLPATILVAGGFLSLGGMSMLVIGLLGLTAPAVLPALAPPAVAWPLIVVGGMLESGGTMVLLGALRARRREAGTEN